MWLPFEACNGVLAAINCLSYSSPKKKCIVTSWEKTKLYFKMVPILKKKKKIQLCMCYLEKSLHCVISTIFLSMSFSGWYGYEIQKNEVYEQVYYVVYKFYNSFRIWSLVEQVKKVCRKVFFFIFLFFQVFFPLLVVVKANTTD